MQAFNIHVAKQLRSNRSFTPRRTNRKKDGEFWQGPAIVIQTPCQFSHAHTLCKIVMHILCQEVIHTPSARLSCIYQTVVMHTPSTTLSCIFQTGRHSHTVSVSHAHTISSRAYPVRQSCTHPLSCPWHTLSITHIPSQLDVTHTILASHAHTLSFNHVHTRRLLINTLSVVHVHCTYLVS